MSRSWRSMVPALVIATAAVTLVGVRDARACGGFFCDRPTVNAGIPIAQAAENVLFVMDTDPDTGAARVEAHIQILYTGPAAQFSWIVPVTAVPTVDVGWDILFDRIEPPTRPSFRLIYAQDGTCQDSGGAACGSSDKASAGEPGPGAQPPPSVDVISSGVIGPYDYVIVKSTDGATLKTWLADNNYYVSDDAGRIVDDYVAGGYSFVAVKLQGGQDTSAIRPIILRLPASEACLPLKLTAIAATPDLRINVWVLASARAIPINYTEVAVNLAKIDWLKGGINYDQLLKEAANEASGDAFAVEYAQPSAASVGWFTLGNPGVVSSLSSEPDPVSYLNALTTTGLTPTNAIVQILRKYIPEPASLVSQGVTETQFYSSISYYWNNNRSQFAPFDPVALTLALKTDIFDPMAAFQTLFGRNTYLTRLATFISPEEMTKDPLFVTDRLLGDVSAQRTADAHLLCGDQEFNTCSAPIRIDLRDGRSIVYPGTLCSGATVDRTDIDAMPSAEMAWNREPDSQGQVVLDNQATIMQALAAHNAKIATPGSGCGCSLRARPHGLAVIGFACAVVALAARRRGRRRSG